MRVRPIEEADRLVVGRLIVDLWGASTVVAHGQTFYPISLPGLLAERGGKVIGLLTYTRTGQTLEIVTLAALNRGRGVGTALVEAVARTARRVGCERLLITTTNDNLDALRFCQRRGFRLCGLRPDAVSRARQSNPEIRLVGEYGITVRDELDLERPVLARR
ncbi:GNAT family N-acetyltransferase [Goodfellowiella coeruleoviolacea]|uniref:Acetyltransferase (GNAT) family protein n=1 Tax=Goodfellowiella coeruleoviolacea TaxID=334858 RepID=A0AAE3GAS2_9PSEU|nr:GNAT family N-acetyltransferase [Goodfellowiella coeruleoviolacea]MCP2164373.1 Acetyltransferase (GNAT) family protein [Goodfellowiella coeruleoviolacea]